MSKTNAWGVPICKCRKCHCEIPNSEGGVCANCAEGLHNFFPKGKMTPILKERIAELKTNGTWKSKN